LATSPQLSGYKRLSRWLVGFFLIPLCLGCSSALVRLISASGDQWGFWIAFITGALIWVVVFLQLPKPMWLYVVGHELTHALWTWVFGGRVKRFRATAQGGHVVITRNNFLITLAPYFFPLYALLWVAGFEVGRRFWGWGTSLWPYHFGLGALYAFHLTLTAHVLQARQPDLQSEGIFFSVMIIWLGNVLVPLLLLPRLVAGQHIWTVLRWIPEETIKIGRWVVGWLG
jgi:hypothetical protein